MVALYIVFVRVKHACFMIIERNESSGSIEITIHDNIIIPGFTLKVLQHFIL